MRSPDSIIKAVNSMADEKLGYDLKVYLFMTLLLILNQDEAQEFTHSSILSSFMQLRSALAFAAVIACAEPARQLSTSLLAEEDGTLASARRYINIASQLYSTDPNLIVHRMITALKQAGLVSERHAMSVVEYKLNAQGAATFTELRKRSELE